MDDMVELMRKYQKKKEDLAGRLAAIGFIWPGNIQWRYQKCGKPNCVCSTDPEARHGPYAYWTTKKSDKTVNKALRPDEAELLEEWIENRRELDAIVCEMKDLSEEAFAVALKLRQKSGQSP
jgi:hypothetical protein